MGTHLTTGDDEVTPQRPLVLLDCESDECGPYTYTVFELESATKARCKACGTVQENERVVDLNEERI